VSISKSVRFEVLRRDGFKCRYCGRRPPEVALEIDHFHPRSRGGLDTVENLITACYDCNRGKAARLIADPYPIKYVEPVIPEYFDPTSDLFEDGCSSDGEDPYPYWFHEETTKPIPWSREAVQEGIIGLAPALRTYTMAADVCASIGECFA